MPVRKPRKKRPDLRYEGYDSKFESDLHRTILSSWALHPLSVSYTVPKRYFPDFVKEVDGKKIFLEVKGRFWDSTEYSKYIHVRESLPEDCEIVFLFYEPNAPMPRAKKRRDGSKRTHKDWAEENNFRWFSKESFPKEWTVS